MQCSGWNKCLSNGGNGVWKDAGVFGVIFYSPEVGKVANNLNQGSANFFYKGLE